MVRVEPSLPELRVANANFLTANLMVGGDLDTRDMRLAIAQLLELVERGVTHIVDVRIERSDEDWVTAVDRRMSYFHHGLDDIGQRVSEEWFEAGVGCVLDAMQDPAAVVLVHCHMGINRSPSLAYAVLLAQGWDVVEALSAIRAARPIAYMSYAEDALRWHLGRTQASKDEQQEAARRVEEWRRDNDLDVVEVIRLKRDQGY